MLIGDRHPNGDMSGSPHSFKPYVLAFEDRKDYFYAAVISNDVRSRFATGDYISEIGRACHESGCMRLLIEKLAPDTLWLWDSIFVLNNFPKIGLCDIRVAIVDQSAIIFDPKGFGVDVGFDPPLEMIVLSDAVEAERWLLQDQND